MVFFTVTIEGFKLAEFLGTLPWKPGDSQSTTPESRASGEKLYAPAIKAKAITGLKGTGKVNYTTYQ